MRKDSLCSSPEAGFSLIEILVAILVLSFTLVAVGSLISRSVFVNTYSQQQLTAAKIAQEGIEIVRARRDNNMLDGVIWHDGLSDAGNSFAIGSQYDHEPDATNYNQISPSTGAISSASPGTLPNTLCVHRTSLNNRGKYTYSCTPADTEPLPGNFTRVVTVTPIHPYSAQVDSTVTWTDGTITISTVLYETQ